MAATAAQIQDVFKEIGPLVCWHFQIAENVIPRMDNKTAFLLSVMTQDEDRNKTIRDWLDHVEGAKLAAEGWQAAVKTALSNYLTRIVAVIIDSPSDSVDEILDDLIEAMSEQASPPQTVKGNTVTVGSIYADEDNVGDGTLGSVTVTQHFAAQRLVVECLNADTEDAEEWQIQGRLIGTLGDTAVTEAVFTDTDTGLVFRIAAGATGFAVGDKHYIEISSDDAGKFQCYFRDQFQKVFDYETDGSETISDALCTLGS